VKEIKIKPFPLMFFLWGIGLIHFGVGEIWSRASISLDGTIISSNTLCAPDNQYRCSSTYILRSNQSGQEVQYQAKGNDASLPKNLPLGTRIHKVKYLLAYEINGQINDDFPVAFYKISAAVGLAFVTAGTIQLVVQSRRSTK
jgi:hypothetical protein